MGRAITTAAEGRWQGQCEITQEEGKGEGQGETGGAWEQDADAKGTGREGEGTAWRKQRQGIITYQVEVCSADKINSDRRG